MLKLIFNFILHPEYLNRIRVTEINETDNIQCIKCWKNRCDIILRTCNHATTCLNCFQDTITECPICFMPITHYDIYQLGNV
jgi:hypothetical protein